MPPELDLKDVSAQFLAELLSMLRGGREFVIEQAPDVIQQWIAWGFWDAAIKAGAALLVCIVTGVAAAKFVRRAREATGPCRYAPIHGVKDREPCRDSFCAGTEPWVAGAIFSTVAAVIAFCVTIGSGIDAAHVAIAPKAWLLEQALRLAR